MDIYNTLATLTQGRNEPIYEYFECFNYYLGSCPHHGFQLHELMKFYLDGMSMKELRIMDIMVGGSIMERTPTEVWYLIQDRAAEMRPYMEYVKFSREEKARQAAEAEYQRIMAEYYKECEEFSKAEHEAKSASEPAQISVDDEEVVVSIEERAEEDIMDEEFGADEPTQFPLFDEEAPLPLYDEEVPLLIEERADEDIVDVELYVVPTMCKEDVPVEEWISPPCSDIILEQNLVITRNPIILPISKMFLSFNVQNDTIKEALCNNQVWGLLDKARIHIPLVTPALDQVLDKFCINWKTRKKGKEVVRCSSKKSDTHSREACDLGPTRRPMKLHLNWKRRKKRCHLILLDAEFSMFSVNVQKNRSSFGWKPGWTWRSISHMVTRKVRRGVRKFDGVHPWAPNIC